jgi:ClpP class serine protease
MTASPQDIVSAALGVAFGPATTEPTVDPSVISKLTPEQLARLSETRRVCNDAHHSALGWQVNAMHRRAQLAEGRAERAEKLVRELTSIRKWYGSDALQSKLARAVEETADVRRQLAASQAEVERLQAQAWRDTQ